MSTTKTNMTPAERALHLRIERLDIEREEVSRRLDLIHKFGEDVYEDGAVIRFDKTLGHENRTFSYCAIKCPNGLWYTSGPVRGGTPYTWGELIGWLASGVPCEEIWLVTDYIEVTR